MSSLPGGIVEDGHRHRGFSFKPLTGAVELAIQEAARQADSIAGQVSHLLTLALADVGGAEPTGDRVRSLSVGDRQFLMRRLALLLGLNHTWIRAECDTCHARFDFSVEQSRLPVKEASAGYPFARAATSLGECLFRVPTGADQETVAEVDDEGQALHDLVAMCLVSGTEYPERFTPEDLSSVEDALEKCAPEVALFAQASCPDCGVENRVYLDPYSCLQTTKGTLLSEVHSIASTYHWSEHEILGLSRARRLQYLELIDRARGMTH